MSRESAPGETGRPVDIAVPFTAASLPKAGGWYWIAVAALSVLFLSGVGSFVFRWQTAWGDRPLWGFYLAGFSFLLSTALAAPVVSVSLRIASGPWRRPVCRVAELFGLAGVLGILWFLPLVRLIPPAQGRLSIWFGLKGAPQVWETMALGALVVCGLALLYLASIPDCASQQGNGKRQAFLRGLAFSWTGSLRQWQVTKSGLLLLGALYFMLLIFVESLFASDFGLSMVPGWKDALFPAYHVATGLQTAVALITVTLFLLRKWGGFREYVGLDTFKGLGRLLLVMTLMWFYFWWSGFIVQWYGRRTEEEFLLQLFMAGPNLPFYALTLGLNFVMPFLLLLFNPIRRSVLGPSIASVLILVGTLFDRIRLFVTSFSVTDTGTALTRVPPVRPADATDILILLGGIAGIALTFLLSIRVFPVLSRWEIIEGLKLKAETRLGRRKVVIVAKPD